VPPRAPPVDSSDRRKLIDENVNSKLFKLFVLCTAHNPILMDDSTMSARTECDDSNACTDTDNIQQCSRDSWLDNQDDVYRREMATLLRQLRSYAVENAEYFSGDAVAGSSRERMYTSCAQLIDHLDGGVMSGVDCLLQSAPMFDYSRLQPGSGYRSMVKVVQKCCLHLLTLVRYIGVNRESYLFRAEHYSRELEAYVTVLGQLRACLYYLHKLVLYCMDGSLFPNEHALSPEDYHTAEYLMKEVESLCQEAFYGRCLGFQVVYSIHSTLSACSTGIHLISVISITQ